MKITYTISKNWEITEAEAYLIKDMYRENKQVMVINFIRMQYPELGLSGAQKICDAIAKPV